MAKFLRMDVLNEMVRTGVVPVFYHKDIDVAIKIVEACVAGGSRVVEFTNRGDNAYRVFSDMVLHFAKTNPSIILGVGSVVDAPTGGIYLSSGANFVVGPVLNAELAKVCNRRKVAYMPGCGTASEINDAEELVVEIVKIFPGDSIGGPDFVKSLLAPMPWSRIMPTGGVKATKESLDAWFKAGVACVGMGSNLIRKDWVESGNFEAISKQVAEVIGLIKEVRGQ